MKAHIVSLLLFTGCSLLVTRTGVCQVTNQPGTRLARDSVLRVAERYTASGWMGDGQAGTKHVQLLGESKENPKSPPTCVKVTYAIGPAGWAGAYWLNKPDNWGDKGGDDLGAKAFKKITFYARGERGGEVVEFKAGGIEENGKKFKDSFEIATGKVRLEKDWKKYEMTVEGKTLSSVIGLFCWVAAGTDNPNGLTFFLDDIQYE
jgi:hypothetical protein